MFRRVMTVQRIGFRASSNGKSTTTETLLQGEAWKVFIDNSRRRIESEVKDVFTNFKVWLIGGAAAITYAIIKEVKGGFNETDKKLSNEMDKLSKEMDKKLSNEMDKLSNEMHKLDDKLSNELKGVKEGKRVWCYECEKYINNEATQPAKDAALKSKFPDGDQKDADDEECRHCA